MIYDYDRRLLESVLDSFISRYLRRLRHYMSTYDHDQYANRLRLAVKPVLDILNEAYDQAEEVRNTNPQILEELTIKWEKNSTKRMNND